MTWSPPPLSTWVAERHTGAAIIACPHASLAGLLPERPQSVPPPSAAAVAIRRSRVQLRDLDTCRLPIGHERWPGVHSCLEESCCAASNSIQSAEHGASVPLIGACACTARLAVTFPTAEALLPESLHETLWERAHLDPYRPTVCVDRDANCVSRGCADSCVALKVGGTSTNGTADAIFRTRSPPVRCAA